MSLVQLPPEEPDTSRDYSYARLDLRYRNAVLEIRTRAGRLTWWQVQDAHGTRAGRSLRTVPDDYRKIAAHHAGVTP